MAASHENLQCVAVSHSSEEHTQTWLQAVGGPNEQNAANGVTVIADPERSIYATWGLGTSGWLHVLHPTALWHAVQLGRQEGIWNRDTESGNRWQTAGQFAVDGNGVVKWGGPAPRADEPVDWEEALDAVGQGGKTSKL